MNFRQLFENKTPVTDYNTWRDQVDAQGGEIHPQRDRNRMVAQSWSGETIGEFHMGTNQGWITPGQPMNEFDAGEGGFGPFKLYAGDAHKYHHVDTFNSLDAAIEEVEFLIDSRPELVTTYWKIVDGTGEQVWDQDPDTMYDKMRSAGKMQFKKPDNKDVDEGLKGKIAGAALAAANLLSPAQAAEEPVKPITIAYVQIDGEVRKYNLGDKFSNAKEAEQFISGVLDKQGISGYTLDIKHGYPKQKTDEAGQGVVEATGDPKFDKMLKGITGKRQVAKQQKADTKQQARDAFGGMFGGGNPADSLGIRKKSVDEGKGDFAQAIENLHGWHEEESNNPDIRIWEFDDREGGYYAQGTVMYNTSTGRVKVKFEDKDGYHGGDVNDTFNSIGDAMNVLKNITVQIRPNTGKAQDFDKLGGRTVAGPDDLYKTDRAGKKGTLNKSRMDTMKASSPYRKTGPKGQLPEQGVAEGTDGYGYKSLSTEQIMKLIQSGNWEAVQDVVPGKHIQLRNNRNGKNTTVHVKQDVAEGFDELDAYIKAKQAPKPSGGAGIKRGSYGMPGRKITKGMQGARLGGGGTGHTTPGNRDFGRPHSIPRAAPRGIDDYDANYRREVDEGEYKDTVDKSKIPAVQRKAQGGDWKVSTQDLEHERSKSPTGATGLAKAKQRLDMTENLRQLPPEVIELLKKVAQSDAAPEHKKAIINSIMAKYQPVKDIAETPTRTAREKFNQGLKRAGFDPEAAAKRLTDLIAKQKAERDQFEKANPAVYGDDKEVKEEKVRLDPKCWTGKKIGNPKTKMKGGVRVNNCVPK